MSKRKQIKMSSRTQSHGDAVRAAKKPVVVAFLRLREDVVARIDDAAQGAGLSRNAFIQNHFLIKFGMAEPSQGETAVAA